MSVLHVNLSSAFCMGLSSIASKLFCKCISLIFFAVFNYGSEQSISRLLLGNQPATFIRLLENRILSTIKIQINVAVDLHFTNIMHKIHSTFRSLFCCNLINLLEIHNLARPIFCAIFAYQESYGKTVRLLQASTFIRNKILFKKVVFQDILNYYNFGMISFSMSSNKQEIIRKIKNRFELFECQLLLRYNYLESMQTLNYSQDN